jgi:hypothetical protein
LTVGDSGTRGSVPPSEEGKIVSAVRLSLPFAARLQALILLSVVCAALTAPPSFGANLARFTDAKDDACCTEDIRGVVVANDDAGMIHFAITAPPVDGNDSSDRFISIATERAEFQIGTHDGPGYVLTRQWRSGRESLLGPVRASDRGDVFRFWLDRHRLGDTDGFNFGISFWSVSSFAANADHAPEFPERWSYEVKIALGQIRPVVRVRQYGAQRSRLTARLALHVGRSDRLLASGTISCAAGAGHRQLRVLSRLFAGRYAQCVWEVPRTALGKLVRGSIGVRITERRSSLKRQSFRLLLT